MKITRKWCTFLYTDNSGKTYHFHWVQENDKGELQSYLVDGYISNWSHLSELDINFLETLKRTVPDYVDPSLETIITEYNRWEDLDG